jgi:hypothetical protein
MIQKGANPTAKDKYGTLSDPFYLFIVLIAERMDSTSQLLFFWKSEDRSITYEDQRTCPCIEHGWNSAISLLGSVGPVSACVCLQTLQK